MARFRKDNTEGYEVSELGEMNRAFEAIFAACPVSNDTKSWQDALAERVQFLFDQGWRGDELIRRADALPG